MDVVNGDITFKANEKLNMPANPQKIGFKFRGGMPIRKELVKKICRIHRVYVYHIITVSDVKKKLKKGMEIFGA